MLPRFWHQTDTVQIKSARRLYLFASGQLKYPSNTLRAGIEGLIYVRMAVMADGTVGRAEITRRKLVEEGADGPYFENGRADLDAEVLRVVQTLRFEPSSIGSDTVTITQRFAMQ